MNKLIKERIEKYVLEQFEELENASQIGEGYWEQRKVISSEIKSYLEILQKEDSLNNEFRINKDKLELDSERIKLEKDKNNNTLIIESKKIDSSEIKNNNEYDLKDKEIKTMLVKNNNDRVDRIIKICIDGATIMVPIMFYGKWMKQGFIFEETGTFTSSTFKNLLTRFKPTK